MLGFGLRVRVSGFWFRVSGLGLGFGVEALALIFSGGCPLLEIEKWPHKPYSWPILV